ncbi:TonB-dependent receptor [Qipengyuania qiaonensis]|uniref:TonB-dependent receptor n=1 Tax=Qipengyuania qiaonensis TaxID=2867240 RepID=A0ABS7J7R3_9SPHN|nr:TonB-dependent receptor [Qipengyuania qiaonensis]MBX7483350.1 TonB-dependent receptor [Qipengyuania qiaonensis]
MKKQLIAASAISLATALAAPAMAQDATDTDREQEASEAEGQRGGGFDEIIVTGRAGTSELRKAEASYAVTTLSDEALRITNPASAAETFKLVPGFWVESSGGEGSNNVRARGIPTDGYSSVALQENGISVQYDGGLGYLNADQSFRFDETIARVEAVRGGPASIYAPNAPGGVVNFITRKGSDNPGGLVKYTWGDYGLNRVDAYYGTSLDDNWGVFVGGFYRESDGMRDMGFKAEKGGQIRGTIDYDDGRNSFALDVKHIEDKVPFYLPVPLTYDENGDIADVPGFDSRSDTLAGGDTTRIDILNVGQPYDFDLTEGSHTQLTQVTLTGALALSDVVRLESKTRYKNADMLRNAVFPTGNVTPIDDYLASLSGALAAFPGATGLQAQYVSDGEVLTSSTNGNGLVIGGNLLSVSVPIDEIIADNRLVAEVEAGGTHNLALGITYGSADYRFDRYMGTSLLDVQGNARLVDVVALDANGDVFGSVTDGGFLRYGSIYDNVSIGAENVAIYGGDEWQITPELRVDAAARWEKINIKGLVAQKSTVSLGDDSTLADDNVLTGNGVFTPVDRSFDDWGWTVGVNYQFSRYAGVFARYTDTFRLPSAGEYNGNPTRTDQRSVPIKMAELGVKYGSSVFNLFATAFYSKFEGVSFTNYRFNEETNQYDDPQVVIADTETFGVELEALVKPAEFFDFALQATWQDPQYKGFTYTDQAGNVVDYDGNQLIRVPKLALRAVPGINLFDGRLRAELEVEHYTKRYPDIANNQTLPSYTLLNINARGEVTNNIILGLNITNLTNELGLTEGNPRAGSFDAGDANAEYFLARPVFGRTVRASLSFMF